MGAIPAKKQAEIEKLLEHGNVDDAFAALQLFVDLKQDDLPSLGKRALSALANDRAAVRKFVIALASPSTTLQRMARRYVGKLGDSAGADLMCLLIESTDPLRRDHAGMLGSFGGYASPVGPSIEKLSYVVKAPAVYSPAAKFLKDVLDNADLLSRFDTRYLVVTGEWGRSRVPHSRLPPFLNPPTWPGAIPEPAHPHFPTNLLQMALREPLGKAAAKAEPTMLRALDRWARGQLLLDEETSDSAIALVHARYLALPSAERDLVSWASRLDAHGYVSELPNALAPILYWQVHKAMPPIPDAFAFMRFVFDPKRKGPYGASAPHPLPPLVASEKPAVVRVTTPSPPSVESRQSLEPLRSPVHPDYGVPLSQALRLLGKAAHGVENILEQRTELDLPKNLVDAVSASLQTEAKQSEVRETPRGVHLRLSPAFEASFVPDEVLESAAWQDELAGRLAATADGTSSLKLAALLLSERQIACAAGAAWQKKD